jgi:hypothetical protein
MLHSAAPLHRVAPIPHISEEVFHRAEQERAKLSASRLGTADIRPGKESREEFLGQLSRFILTATGGAEKGEHGLIICGAEFAQGSTRFR